MNRPVSGASDSRGRRRERPNNFRTFLRQAFPQPAWTHAQAPLRAEHGEAGRGQRLMPTPIDMLDASLCDPLPDHGGNAQRRAPFLTSLNTETRLIVFLCDYVASDVVHDMAADRPCADLAGNFEPLMIRCALIAAPGIFVVFQDISAGLFGPLDHGVNDRLLLRVHAHLLLNHDHTEVR
jgi:hypothetical protein